MSLNESPAHDRSMQAYAFAPRVTQSVYTAAIFLNALLLLSVQPMLAKMILPMLGGSSSVWAVCLCVFQCGLFLGCCYAFALNRLMRGSRSVWLHVAVLAVASSALPVALPQSQPSVFAADTY